MIPGFHERKRFADLSEQEILALAISSEEEDSRIYATYAERLRPDYPQSAAMFAAHSAGFAVECLQWIRTVSAGAKILIVPVEKSPPPRACGVTPTLGTRGGLTPVQGERRGRDQ